MSLGGEVDDMGAPGHRLAHRLCRPDIPLDKRTARIVLDLARQEPDNINAWAQLARAAGSNHRLILLAFDNFFRLSPRLRRH